MKKQSIVELSIEELVKQQKSLKGILAGFAIVMLIAITALLYLIFKKQLFSLIAFIPALTCTLLPVIIRLAQINTEIKKR